MTRKERKEYILNLDKVVKRWKEIQHSSVEDVASLLDR